MTVELIATSVNRYTGTSQDRKPANAPIGSTFEERDGIIWICTAAGWEPDSNYLAIIAGNTNSIVQGLSQQHLDNLHILAQIKRITKR